MKLTDGDVREFFISFVVIEFRALLYKKFEASGCDREKVKVVIMKNLEFLFVLNELLLL